MAKIFYLSTRTLILVVILTIIVGSSVVKNLYWPPIHYDTIAGYSQMGKALYYGDAKELIREGSRFSYPPFLPFLYALCLPINIKIPNSIFYIMLVVVFYLFMLKLGNGVERSLLFTIILSLTPNIYAYSSLSLTNIPLSSLILMGVYLMYCNEWVWSVVIFGFAGMIRGEAIIFMVYPIYRSCRWWSVAMLIPLIIWNMYLIHLEVNVSRFYFPNIDNMKMLFAYSTKAMFQFGVYGIIFPLFFWMWLRRRIDRIVMNYILISFTLYAIMFTMIDPSKMGCTLDKLFSAGYVRGLIVFAPLCLLHKQKNE